MFRRTCFAIVSVILALSDARADTAPKAAPRFTLAEEVIIARNDALNALLPVDPWGVRKILDAVATAKQSDPPTGGGQTRDVTGDPRLRDGNFRIDPTQNPDLNILFQRASPEAAYDLFQILKRVGGTSAAN